MKSDYLHYNLRYVVRHFQVVAQARFAIRRSSVLLLLAVIFIMGCSGEADGVADDYMAARVRLCGDSYFTLEPDGGLVELRDLSWTVEAKEETEAERLNGVTFKGVVLIKYSARRNFWSKGEGSCWHPWYPDGFPRSLYVEGANGKWKFEGTWFGLDGIESHKAPSCSEIPRTSQKC